MLRNYFKIIFRTLWKQRFYTAINILGLSVGMACVLLISLYILDELSYDRFHEKADRIYRLGSHIIIGESDVELPLTSAAVSQPFLEEVPEVAMAVRMVMIPQKVQREDQSFLEDEILAADPGFFKLFSFSLIAGNPETVLAEPNSVVLTEAKANHYFPDGDALENTLYIKDELHKVTGIMEEMPAQSHFHSDMVYSFSTLGISEGTDWGAYINIHTYFLLNENNNIKAVNGKLDGLIKKYVKEYEQLTQMGGSFEMFVQPLTDIHLHSYLMSELEPNSSINTLYIFGAIALFIILLASINFLNLATARSADRAKEVGVRKALGSLRTTLVRQFLAESLLMSVVAMLLALALAELLRFPFNQIAGKEIGMNIAENLWLLPAILLFTLLIGLLAGSYPAFYLTRFRPVEVLRGRIVGGSKDSRFRNSLVVFQFVISTGLIVCTLLVYQQLQYIQNKELGFDRENVIILRQTDQLKEHRETFRQALVQHTGVQAVSFSSREPLGVQDGAYFSVKGRDKEGQLIKYTFVSHDYPEVIGAHLKEGRSFSRDIAGDTAAVVVNEVVVKQLGIENPIGSVLERGGGDLFTIVGVLENYHFESFHTKIQPLILILNEDYYLTEIKIQSENLKETLAFVEKTWRQYAPATSFEYTFLNEDFDALFRAEQRLGKIFAIFTGLAIFVACLGLLALAAFMAEQRTKEIGIRKVLGAGVGHIVILLSKDFTKLVLIAFIIALPLGYFAMSRWLENFAYRIEIGVGVFVLTGVVSLVIAWVTVGYQSVKAAVANPVKSLRSE